LFFQHVFLSQVFDFIDSASGKAFVFLSSISSLSQEKIEGLYFFVECKKIPQPPTGFSRTAKVIDRLYCLSTFTGAKIILRSLRFSITRVVTAAMPIIINSLLNTVTTMLVSFQSRFLIVRLLRIFLQRLLLDIPAGLSPMPAAVLVLLS
jgi:hypothetical protein